MCTEKDCLKLNCSMCGCESCIYWSEDTNEYDFDHGQSWGKCEVTGELTAYGGYGGPMCDNFKRTEK